MPIEQRAMEIVERKGIGHPDTIADALAESVSRALCELYLERFGRILHHNTDEAQIVGGQSAPRFGGGVILEPAYILLAGRAITKYDDLRLPIRATAIRATREYLKRFPHLDVDSDVMLDCRIGRSSLDLRDVYSTESLRANDSSVGTGFAPLSETETITIETERYINGPLKQQMPQLGEDVKVMSLRRGDRILLTIAVSTICSELPDIEHYISTKERLMEAILALAKRYTSKEVKVQINTADEVEKGIVYLTVTGLSMENGDDGSAGRGNRVNGLITPCRPMSAEAAAGKNPVTHVGKLYNVLAREIAQEVVEEGGGDVMEAYIWLLSQIGTPIDHPQLAHARLVLAKGVPLSKVMGKVEGLIDHKLENIGELTERSVREGLSIF